MVLSASGRLLALCSQKPIIDLLNCFNKLVDILFYIHEHIYLWVTFYNVTYDVGIRFLGQHRGKIMLMVYEPKAGSYKFFSTL